MNTDQNQYRETQVGRIKEQSVVNGQKLSEDEQVYKAYIKATRAAYPC